MAIISMFSERPTMTASAFKFTTKWPKSTLSSMQESTAARQPTRRFPLSTVNRIAVKAPVLIAASSAKFSVPVFWTNTPPIEQSRSGVDILIV